MLKYSTLFFFKILRIKSKILVKMLYLIKLCFQHCLFSMVEFYFKLVKSEISDKPTLFQYCCILSAELLLEITVIHRTKLFTCEIN